MFIWSRVERVDPVQEAWSACQVADQLVEEAEAEAAEPEVKPLAIRTDGTPEGTWFVAPDGTLYDLPFKRVDVAFHGTPRHLRVITFEVEAHSPILTTQTKYYTHKTTLVDQGAAQ